MDTEVCRNLVYVKQKEKISANKRILDKIITTSSKINESDNPIKTNLLLGRLSLEIVEYAIMIPIVRERMQNLFMKYTLCEKSDIAWDENELVNNKNASYIINSIRYSGPIPQACLSNIKAVWQDFDVFALKNQDIIGQLQFVGGNFYSSATKLPSSLQYVVGDMYVEHLDEIRGLSQMKFVGGKIYCQDKVLTLDDIKELNKRKYIKL